MLNKERDNNQVNILLTYLINYFKSVFARQGRNGSSGEEEINFMLNYMAIQKFRFAGAMHLQCEIGAGSRNQHGAGYVCINFCGKCNQIFHGFLRMI